MTIGLIATGLVVLVVSTVRWRRQRARRRYPQDFAFAMCTGFGPQLGQPRELRIRRVFPQLKAEVMAAWLQDFARVYREIERLARRGGPQRLGNAVVEEELRRAFPFLVGAGLRQAVFLVGYSAMHEGYDTSPDPEPGS